MNTQGICIYIHIFIHINKYTRSLSLPRQGRAPMTSRARGQQYTKAITKPAISVNTFWTAVANFSPNDDDDVYLNYNTYIYM
jgi:hypothetical protein